MPWITMIEGPLLHILHETIRGSTNDDDDMIGGHKGWRGRGLRNNGEVWINRKNATVQIKIKKSFILSSHK